MSQTYTKRSNARRAGIAAGIPAEEVEITVHKTAGEAPRFGFKRKETLATAPAKANTAAKRVPAITTPAATQKARNGVVRPAAGGRCAAVWQWLDHHPTAKLADVRAWAEKTGQNVGNASQELYRWRKFTGAAGHASAGGA